MEGVTFIAMLLLPSIYMLEPCMSIRYAGNNAWLMKLIGGSIALVFMLVKLHYYEEYVERYAKTEKGSFEKFLESLLGRGGAMLFILIWSAVFFLQTAILLRQLADNTVMLAVPSLSMEMVAQLFAVFAYLLCRNGLETLLRCAYVFFMLGVIGVGMLLIGLSGEYNYLELLPWQGNGLGQTLRHGLIDSGTWLAGMAIFALAPNLRDCENVNKAITRGFLITIAVKAAMLLCLVMLFGSVVASERTQLFYEAVRTFHFSPYIQRLDSIFIFIWLTGGFLSVTLSLYMAVSFFGLTFRLNDIRPLLPLGAAAAAGIAILPEGVMEIFQWGELMLYHGGTIVLVADFLVVSGAYYLFKRRKRLCQS